MPQLALSDKINPIVSHSQLDRQTALKRVATAYSNQHFPFARGPVRVPTKRISESKLVPSGAGGATSNHSDRSKSAPKPPRRTLKQRLIKEYGKNIHSHLKTIEANTKQHLFLGRHQIQADYRAKMVDWMLEVLTTFKNSE